MFHVTFHHQLDENKMLKLEYTILIRKPEYLV